MRIVSQNGGGFYFVGGEKAAGVVKSRLMPKPADVIVLAAGRGRRLRAATPKPLLMLAEKPLLAHVLAAAVKLAPRRIVVVVPPDSSDSAALRAVARSVYPKTEFAVQPSPRGTADAARCGAQLLGGGGIAFVLCADAPLIAAATLQKMRRSAAAGAPALMCFVAKNPSGYGRIVRGGGIVSEIVEEKDTDVRQRKICEVFAGALAADAAWLKSALPKLRADNAAGELYLTGLVALARRQNIPARAVFADAEETLGVNTPSELAAAAAVLRRRRAEMLMARGARIADPLRLDVRGEVRAGRDVEIDVNVILSGLVVLGKGSSIGA
ncbi:MAG: NTP transferase domain-containing protein, partial [Betaproteobacteria bacterium]|nr:NTP transferase domain-containing protein [Betaproteobacteria bacterium]